MSGERDSNIMTVLLVPLPRIRGVNLTRGIKSNRGDCPSISRIFYPHKCLPFGTMGGAVDAGH